MGALPPPLPDSLPHDDLRYLDQTFGFSRTGNNEILFSWMEYCIRDRYTAIYPALESFLNEVGRRKYVKPLFQVLLQTPEGKIEAKKSTPPPDRIIITSHRQRWMS